MKTALWILSVFSMAAAGCVEPPTVVIEPLRIINWSPASGAVCVDTTAQVLVTFSDDIDTETLTAESFQLIDASGAVPAAIGYDKATFTATLTPAADLEIETEYTVEITVEVTGSDQGPLPAEVSSRFETVGRFGCTP